MTAATLAAAAREAAEFASRLNDIAATHDRRLEDLRDLNKAAMQAYGTDGERDALGALWEAVDELTRGAE